MIAFYKATRPDGTDFYSGLVDYAAALVSGEPLPAPWPVGVALSDWAAVAAGWADT